MKGPVRVGSLKPATVALMLGAVVGVVAFVAGIGVALVLFIVGASASVPALIVAGAVVAAVGAVCGWAAWRTTVDRIDWPRLEAEQRQWRSGELGRARVRARRLLDRRDG